MTVFDVKVICSHLWDQKPRKNELYYRGKPLRPSNKICDYELSPGSILSFAPSKPQKWVKWNKNKYVKIENHGLDKM